MEPLWCHRCRCAVVCGAALPTLLLVLKFLVANNIDVSPAIYLTLPQSGPAATAATPLSRNSPIVHPPSSAATAARPLLSNMNSPTKALRNRNACRSFPVDPYHERSGCFTATWDKQMAKVDPDGAGKVFIDVGCNTGTESANWLDLWGAQPDVLHDYRAVLEKTLSSDRIGACRQNFNPSGARRTGKAKRSSADPLVICVEPVLANVHLVGNTSAKVFKNGGPKVVHSLVSNHTGRQMFFSGYSLAKGAETFGFDNPNAKLHHFLPDVDVGVTTVDALVEQYGLASVDVLTIDTEGHDPAVIHGAETTLRTKVRYLVFEVHRNFATTVWGKTKLAYVVDLLDSWNFDCYYAIGAKGLRRVTGCWTERDDDRLGALDFGNVVCAKRGDPWHAVLEGFDVA